MAIDISKYELRNWIYDVIAETYGEKTADEIAEKHPEIINNTAEAALIETNKVFNKMCIIGLRKAKKYKRI